MSTATLLRFEHELNLPEHAYYEMFLEHVSPERGMGPRPKDLGPKTYLTPLPDCDRLLP